MNVVAPAKRAVPFTLSDLMAMSDDKFYDLANNEALDPRLDGLSPELGKALRDGYQTFVAGIEDKDVREGYPAAASVSEFDCYATLRINNVTMSSLLNEALASPSL